MRHFCQRALFLLFVATVACNDSTGPTLPVTFELVNINGRGLPTYLSPTPGLSTTVLSAYLHLDNAGTASWFERRREFGGAEITIAHTVAYMVRGNRIDIGPTECPSDANCITFSGSISNDALSLVVGRMDLEGSIVYNYRLATPIPAI
jgi:hypothetical protein